METKEHEISDLKITKAEPRKYEYVYWNILVFLYYHLAAVYGVYLLFTSAKWQTILFVSIAYWCGAVGVITGAHRLWSHKSYKATKPLQLILMLAQSMANQHSIIHWVRDHRLHHKYSDSDADPHNANRGFFYSHIGWLMVRKHPEVIKRGKKIDISDLMNNPILKWQHDNNMWLLPLLAFVLPTYIPMHFWGESFTNAFHLNMARYVINLNLTFIVNSIAHLWGYKPIDKSIAAAGNVATFYLSFGEGLHNYHHVFPCDYKSAELKYLDIMSKVIDFFAFFGMAYDLKTVNPELVKARANRTGDGSAMYLLDFY